MWSCARGTLSSRCTPAWTTYWPLGRRFVTSSGGRSLTCGATRTRGTREHAGRFQTPAEFKQQSEQRRYSMDRDVEDRQRRALAQAVIDEVKRMGDTRPV